MAVGPEKDANAKGTSDEAPVSKPESARTSWEERRASRPPITPAAKDEPFAKSPSTRPPAPLELELSGIPAPVTKAFSEEGPKRPSSPKVPAADAPPRSVDPES